MNDEEMSFVFVSMGIVQGQQSDRRDSISGSGFTFDLHPNEVYDHQDDVCENDSKSEEFQIGSYSLFKLCTES